MVITLTVAGGADGLRSLTRELGEVDELRGAVRPAAGAPRPGELGALTKRWWWLWARAVR